MNFQTIKLINGMNQKFQKDIEKVIKKIRFKKKLNLRKFKLGDILGEGTHGKVF